MRMSSLSALVAIGFMTASTQAAAEECPLDLSLKTSPDALVARLKALPSLQSARKANAQPFTGTCSYQTSTFMQMALPPGGLCTVGGQPAVMSATDILDSSSTVVSQGYMLLKSDESLSALKSALGKIAKPVPRDADPKAWTAENHWLIDAVYAQGDELWVVTHETLDPGETRSAPETCQLSHVRREWLDFSRRDFNTCAELPASAQGNHHS